MDGYDNEDEDEDDDEEDDDEEDDDEDDEEDDEDEEEEEDWEYGWVSDVASDGASLVALIEEGRPKVDKPPLSSRRPSPPAFSSFDHQPPHPH